jgi:hypothetical protein
MEKALVCMLATLLDRSDDCDSQTDVGEFPHMAAIGFSDEVDESKLSYDCGGSLISKVKKLIFFSELIKFISFRISC